MCWNKFVYMLAKKRNWTDSGTDTTKTRTSRSSHQFRFCQYRYWRSSPPSRTTMTSAALTHEEAFLESACASTRGAGCVHAVVDGPEFVSVLTDHLTSTSVVGTSRRSKEGGARVHLHLRARRDDKKLYQRVVRPCLLCRA